MNITVTRLVFEDTNGKPIISGEILKMHGWFIKDVYIGNQARI